MIAEDSGFFVSDTYKRNFLIYMITEKLDKIPRKHFQQANRSLGYYAAKIITYRYTVTLSK